MKALAQRYPFPTNHHFVEKSMQVHKERVKAAKKCIDNGAPQYFYESHERKSPTRKLMAKAAADDYLQRENFILAQRIFKIMQGESEITAQINHNDHLENHPGTMNFRQRLEEAQRVHHKNLMFAIRMQSIKPYYKTEDITTAKPLQHHVKPLPVGLSPRQGSKPTRRVRANKKSKAIRAFERTLQQQQQQQQGGGGVGDATNINNDNNNPLGLYHGYVLGSRDEGEREDEFLDPKRFRSVLLEYTKSQDNRLLDIVVLKEPFRDRYAIFGLDADDGQKYELRLTSEDVSSILDGDILVTSVEHVEVWMALLSKVKLRAVGEFNQLPFSSEEMDLVSTNSRRRKRLEDMTLTDIDNNKREAERPYFMPSIDNNHQQVDEVEETKLYVTRKEKDDDLIKQVLDEPLAALPVQQLQPAPPSRPSGSRQSSSKGVSPRPQLLSQQSKRASSQEQEPQPVVPAFPSRPNSTRPSAPPSSQGSRGGRRVVIANNTNTTAAKPATVVDKQESEVSQQKSVSEEMKEKKQPVAAAAVAEKKVAVAAAAPAPVQAPITKEKSVELEHLSAESVASVSSEPIVAKKEEPVIVPKPATPAAAAPVVADPPIVVAKAAPIVVAEEKAIFEEESSIVSEATARSASLTKIVDDVVTKALSQAIMAMESRRSSGKKAVTPASIEVKPAVSVSSKIEVKTSPTNTKTNDKVSQLSSVSSVGSTTNKTAATKMKSEDYSSGISAPNSITSSGGGGGAKKTSPTNNKQTSVTAFAAPITAPVADIAAPVADIAAPVADIVVPVADVAAPAIELEGSSIVEDLQGQSIEGSLLPHQAPSAAVAMESSLVESDIKDDEAVSEPQPVVAKEGSIETSGDGGSGNYEDDYEADFDSNA